MFKVETVHNCPQTRRSNGIIYLEPALISQLSAAVYDKDEWAILLLGVREADGWIVRVTDYTIPPQNRTSAHVELPEFDLEPEVVGVVHSHHNMGAHFSSTDVNKLNPRFASSIVVGQDRGSYLGFEYEAVGKVVLTCGAVGSVSFYIQPTVGPDVSGGVVKNVHSEKDLGDCVKSRNLADQFHVQILSDCGLQEEKVELKARAFGQSNMLLDRVKELPRPKPPALKGNKDFGALWRGQKFAPKVETVVEPIGRKATFIEGIDCEVCGDANEFWQWTCDNCGQGEYCMVCGVGHNPAVGCPKESELLSLT